MDGKIALLKKDKGFGFIITSAGRRFFFHKSDLRPNIEWHHIEEGDTVVFDAVTPQPEKGPRAENVGLS